MRRLRRRQREGRPLPERHRLRVGGDGAESVFGAVRRRLHDGALSLQEQRDQGRGARRPVRRRGKAQVEDGAMQPEALSSEVIEQDIWANREGEGGRRRGTWQLCFESPYLY